MRSHVTSPPDLLAEDRSARNLARDPTRSCLVQAPAGSGKTTLLVERYLRLLERVDQPEEILALTFTRKAQAEMAHRIWRALVDASPEATLGDVPGRIRERSARLGWELERLPERLRIMTIDGFALSLIQKMPWSAAGGAVPEPTEDAPALYLEAARRVIEDLLTEVAYREALSTWLNEVGGDPEALVRLLVSMLERREQWQGLVFALGREDDWNPRLEVAKTRILEEALGRFEGAIPPRQIQAWLRLADELPRKPEPTQPSAEPEDSVWTRRRRYARLVELFFTQEGNLRKPGGLHVLLGKKQSGHAHQDRLRESLEKALAVLEKHTEYVQALRELASLPAGPEGNSPLLGDLMTLLVRALHHLKDVFRETGQADFAEITELACKALGTETPTDLALALDYRIQHILVDEFQDTSIAHYTLIQSLMRGWEPGDGHTFFAVGDPMQSIYRFRQAEVGVFLNCGKRGIAGLALEEAILHDNYRSHPALVDWLNEHFAEMFPQDDQEDIGAVRYVPARSGYTDRDPQPVALIHRLSGPEPRLKARLVADLIRTERAENPTARMAVLFQTHSEATPVAEHLRAEAIPFRGLDLEPLLGFGVTQDLQMLASALLHPGDRLAWLTVLRGPWVGLSMADLTVVADSTPSVLHPAHLRSDWPGLSASGQARLKRVLPVLQEGFHRLARTVDLRNTLEATWIALGGPATLRTDFDRALAECFWNALDELSPAELRSDPTILTPALERLTAPLESQLEDPRLELLTIHRAKGLEWDVVILAGLDRGIRIPERGLLNWLERVGPGGTDVVLATRDPKQAKRDSSQPVSWYGYLRGLEQQKDAAERTRLAYVAATRARERLHLIAYGQGSEAAFKPRRGSLAEVFCPLFEAVPRPEGPDPATSGSPENPVPGQREVLPQTFPAIVYPEPLIGSRAGWVASREPVRPVYDWAETQSRIQGTVLHELCDRIARDGLDGASSWIRPEQGARSRWRRRLVELGMPSEHLEESVTEIARMWERILADRDAGWILGPHPWSASEFALHGVDGKDRVAVRVDRLFRDEKGVLWLIDYKLGRHEGGGLATFLAREEERYRPQLERYARLLQATIPGPIAAGLYFFHPACFRRLELG